jgi:hypothetical protein
MRIRVLGPVAAVCAAAFCCASFAANGPPLASVWNIAPTGKADSSGDLTFRITAADGSDPIEITVPVLLGARPETVARGIRNSLSAQLPRQRFDVELGAGTNVLVSDPRGQPNFSIELLDSDVESLRVAVQSVTPSAAPTAPPQTLPAEAPPVVTPPPANAPGNANPPANPAAPNNPPGTSAPGTPPGTTAPGTSSPGTPPGTTSPGSSSPGSPAGNPASAPGTPSAPQGTSSPTPSPAPGSAGSAAGGSPPPQ